MLVAVWLFALSCLVLWSLVAWGMHALLTADPHWVGDLGELADKVPFGEWIERWIPGWQALLQLALELVQSSLAWVGSAAPLVVWVAWGVGAMLVVFGAALVTAMVVVLRPKATAA